MCKIPGCFLNNFEKLKEYSGRNFKHNKEELAQKIYMLLNHTVFDGKVESKNKYLLNTSCTPACLAAVLTMSTSCLGAVLV